jgi:hypothetical protein
MADDQGEKPAMDMIERRRTWRRFISAVAWLAAGAVLLLLALLIFRTKG